MGTLKSVTINKGTVGANAALPDASTSGMIIVLSPIYVNSDGGDVNVPIVAAFNSITKITSLAEAVGIVPVNFDTTCYQIVYQHLVEFYSMAAEGTPLYVMLVSNDAATVSDVLDVNYANYAKKLLTETEGQIKQLAIAYSPDNTVTEISVDGLSAQIRAAIPKAQELYDWAYLNDKPCQILLEGRIISGQLQSIIDLRAIPVGNSILNAHKVSVVIGQDWSFADYHYGVYDDHVHEWDYFYPLTNYASVGKVLGTISAAEVNQSIGEVDEASGGFNLTNVTKNQFVIGGLSNHQTIKEADAILGDLDAKGYIFPRTYYGVSGLRWNGDHVCCPIVIDDNGNINEHTIYYGRTMDYTALALKVHFMQYMKKRAFADVTTGNLSTGVIKVMEKDANTKVFGKLFNNQLISGGNTTIDKTSDLVTPPKKLKIGFVLVPTIIIDNIEGTIYLNRSL